MTATDIVRARIDHATKVRAAAALADMGLSISDAIRLLMMRIADERRMPFEVRAPGALTRAAIEELEQGKGRRFDSVGDLMKSLRDEEDR
jgi:DNA-damage-inducible protein J